MKLCGGPHVLLSTGGLSRRPRLYIIQSILTRSAAVLRLIESQVPTLGDREVALVLIDVLLNRPLGDRADDSADGVAADHDEQGPEEDGRQWIARVSADKESSGKTDQGEAGCDDAGGDDEHSVALGLLSRPILKPTPKI